MLKDRMDEEVKKDINSEFEKIKENIQAEMTAYAKKFEEQPKKKGLFKF